MPAGIRSTRGSQKSPIADVARKERANPTSNSQALLASSITQQAPPREEAMSVFRHSRCPQSINTAMQAARTMDASNPVIST